MKNIYKTLLLFFFVVSSVAAQDVIEGRWKGEVGFSKMCLSLKSSLRSDGDRWDMSFSEDILRKEFKGLEAAMKGGAGTEFELPREAGTFTFKGEFRNDRGAGDFKFVVNPDFSKNMKALGYNKIDDDQVFHLAISDVGTAFVKELQAAGYNKIAIDKLVQMVIHGVTPAFVKEMSELGYKNLPVDQLVQLRIHGVDADYVREMNAALQSSSKNKK